MSLRCIAICLFSATCGAFQVAPPRLRSATAARPSSRVLEPYHAPHPTSSQKQKLSQLNAVHRSRNNEGVNIPTTADRRNRKSILSRLVGGLKRVLDVGIRGRRSAATSFLLSLSIFLLPLFALTAFPDSSSAVHSGGRMGGSFGGGGRRQSSSRSYSAPRSRSNGIGGSGGGYSRGLPAGRGYSSSSYSRPRGCSSGPYSRPNIIVSPRMGGRSPFYSPYYARSSGAGAVAVANPNPFRGIIFMAGLFIFASYLSSAFDGGFRGYPSSSAPSVYESVLGRGVSVAEISVALDVPDRDSPNSVLSALSRLSRTSSTDSRLGIQNLTSQVAMELLRRKASIVAASTSASHYRDGNKAQKEYNTASIRQRGKFERETLSKYGGVDYGDNAQTEPTESEEYNAKATIAVVTIVMMIDGDSTSKQLSSNINSIRNVEDALTCIAADAKADNCLRGAEILWCPEQREDTMTMRDVLADYPSLRSI